MTRRVAIIGASGIGKHHANWWRLEGAAVCAFAGSSAASVGKTQDLVREMLGYAVPGYADVAEMLHEARPDIVDVCSPAAWHAAHVRMALDAGCSVLCEKPFVYESGRSKESLMDEARALFALAAMRGLRLTICTQYQVCAAWIRRQRQARFPGAPIRRFEGRLEAPAKDRGPDPERIWVDLSPHLLSMVLEWFPGASLEGEHLRTRFQEYDAETVFTLNPPGHPPVVCALHTRNRTEPPTNIRRFVLDGYPFEIQAARDEAGVFCVEVETPDGVFRQDDFMRQLIRDVLAGNDQRSPESALTNLEWMLEILARGKTGAA